MAYVKMKAIKTTVKKALDYILREEKVGEKNLDGDILRDQIF